MCIAFRRMCNKKVQGHHRSTNGNDYFLLSTAHESTSTWMFITGIHHRQYTWCTLNIVVLWHEKWQQQQQHYGYKLAAFLYFPWRHFYDVTCNSNDNEYNAIWRKIPWENPIYGIAVHLFSDYVTQLANQSIGWRIWLIFLTMGLAPLAKDAHHLIALKI